MDTRDTPEQAALRRSARQLARDLGPANVADIYDEARRQRLATAVRDAGWLDLRDETGWAVEAAIIAEALGASVADVAFTGPLLAADLARRAGRAGATAIAFAPDLASVAVVAGAPTIPLYALDCNSDRAYVLARDQRLATVPVDANGGGADLTRTVRVISPGAPAEGVAGQVSGADLAGWSALGLALTSADLVGVMRGVLDVTVDYAIDRRQFGVSVGSFQAVQHLLAEAKCLLEGSASIALYAAWAVDNLHPAHALTAGRAAKAYCARAARTVCETAVQVHGGIGNTWECIVHVYLRRALLSAQWFGDDSAQLARLSA